MLAVFEVKKEISPKGVTPMRKANPIVLALVAIYLLAAPLMFGQGANPPASTKESGATSGHGMTAVEQAGQKAPTRRYINLPNRPVQAPFSDGVLIGGTLYVAGRIGIDPKTGKPPEDLEQEIKILLDGIKSVLQEAGMTMDDLVSVQVFCSDVSLYDKFNSAYRGYFGKDYPARAFVGSGPLLRGGHFEMLGIAVKR
jgi:2-iminobutanoate/2-iminopropanoate deaminase